MEGANGMSTVVVVKKGDRVCIAADTLTTWGHTLEPSGFVENHEKIGLFGDSYIASVGHASTQLVLRSYFSRFDEEICLGSVDEIFETFRVMHRVLKEEYFMNPGEEPDDPYEATRFNVVIANTTGIYGVFSLRTVQSFSRFFAFGSGAEYALGAMSAMYDTMDDPEAIAARAVEVSSSLDDGTGMPCSSYVVELEG